jgi:hypothetical protein
MAKRKSKSKRKLPAALQANMERMIDHKPLIKAKRKTAKRKPPKR